MVRVLAIGDISFCCYSEASFNNSAGYKETLRFFKDYDGIKLGNLECSLSHSKQLNMNKIGLISDPKFADYLPSLDILNLANNHSTDAGEDGIAETIQVLKQIGISTIGFGCNIYEARKPIVREHNGIKVGFLAYSCLTTNGENYATATKEGVCPIAAQYVDHDVRRLKYLVDHVVILFHWGVEQNHYPTPDQIGIAHKAIDCGASLVVGTHPHVIQGVEKYNNGLIAYSLGNFLSADLNYQVIRDEEVINRQIKRTKYNKESIGIEVIMDKKKIELKRILPFKLDDLFAPTMVELKDLETDFDESNIFLNKYVKDQKSFLDSIEGLNIKVVFNGEIYQNRYALETIDRQAILRQDLHNPQRYLFLSSFLKKIFKSSF